MYKTLKKINRADKCEFHIYTFLSRYGTYYDTVRVEYVPSDHTYRVSEPRMNLHRFGSSKNESDVEVAQKI